MRLRPGLKLSRSPVASATVTSPTILQDNFNDNSRDAAKWTTGQWSNSVSSVGGTVSEANQRLEITPPASVAGARFTGYISAATWDMTGNAIFAKITNIGASLTANQVVHLAFGADNANKYRAILETGTTMRLQKLVANANSNLGSSFTYDPSVHTWWRLRHGGSGDDTIYLDTAPSTASDPPVSGDWTNRVSAARDTNIAISAATLALQAGCAASVASPTAIYFDGFNIATA